MDTESPVKCISNEGYPASLKVGRVYRRMPNGEPELGLVRVVDESGDDYLFPEEFFEPARRLDPKPSSRRFVPHNFLRSMIPLLSRAGKRIRVK